MPTTAPPRLVTARQVLARNSPYRECELWDGVPMVRSPSNPWPARVAMLIAHALENYVRPRGLGIVMTADAGYLLARNPDRMLAPDVSFVVPARTALIPRRGFAPFAPDLVVEVRSPDDVWGAQLTKAGVWLAHGARLVWVVDPDTRVVVAKRHVGDHREHGLGDVLSGAPVLPHFRLRVDEVFEGIP